ncbi:MAG TPA: DNA-processing protein DprA [Acidimicrobiia bacterium]|jgi:DNA processing protein
MSDDDVAAVALASLPEMGPVRLRKLLDACACSPACASAAFALVSSGRVGSVFATDPRASHLAGEWAKRAASIDLPGLRATLEQRGTRVMRDGSDGYPIEDGLPDRPPLLLGEGAREIALDGPRVAVVGTRAATPHGLADAYDLGADLAGAGITVVSGLAIGVDAAAHEGALDADGSVIGVIGTGLDCVYPRRHERLHARVRESGMLVTEYPLGTGPHQSHFPVRNRIIAMLADVVVVVEGTESGGTRFTADKALEYGRTLMAIPGSRRNPVAAGCNALIAQGAQPLLRNEDVIEALGMTPGARRHAQCAEPESPDQLAVLAALGGEPATVDEIAARTSLTPGKAAVAIGALVRSGAVRRASGLLWPM